ARRHTGLLVGVTLLALVSALVGGLWAKLEQERRVVLDASKQLTRAEQEKAQARDEAERAQQVLEHFNKARDLVRRGAVPEQIIESVELGLKESERSAEALLTGASIYEQAKLKEQRRVLLEETVKKHSPAYQALFYLHIIEIEESGQAKFYVTKSLL